MTTNISFGNMTLATPESLLEYCQIQLGNLDDQVQGEMAKQQLQLQERTAVQNVADALEKFGDAGPSNANDMKTCVEAFDTAIASLPQGDPVAAQLQSQLDTMKASYGFSDAMLAIGAGPTATGIGAAGSGLMGAIAASYTFPVAGGTPPPAAGTSQESVTMSSPPTGGEWKGTVDALTTLAGNVKDGAEIQMLTLQDLVSQRQQVVALSTGIMTKEDETLTDGAKAIGQ